MSAVSMAGIRPEQGPPLSVPLSFFATGALALVAAGGVLGVTGGQDGGSAFSGFSLGLLHLVTVGFLLSVMWGALYQLLPVVAHAVVPLPRLAHGVQGLLALGVLALAWGFVAGEPKAFVVAAALLGSAILGFGVPVAVAVLRARAGGPTPWGLRLAVLGFLSVTSLGLRMAWGRGGAGYTPGWLLWRHAHAHLGLITWMGVLVAAVSWQVVPMFYLAAPTSRAVQRTVLGACATTLLGLTALFAFDGPEWALPWCVAPGALAVWSVQPWVTFRAIAQRKRRRSEPSLWFWRLSMGAAPCVLLLGALAWWFPELGSLYLFAALWGWAGAVVHGMLTRIIPFLVWLHRCSRWVGLRPVPNTRELYPDRLVWVGLSLHLATLLAGVGALRFDEPWLWRALGAGLAATGLLLLGGLLHALWRSPRAQAGSAETSLGAG